MNYLSQYQNTQRRQVKLSDVHAFQILCLVTNMKAAKSVIIFFPCTIIESRIRHGLLAQLLACQTVEPEDKDRFPDVHLFFSVFFTSFFAFYAEILHTSKMEL